MYQYAVTHTEANLLAAVGDDLEATLAELTAATRLTPTDVRTVLARLARKGLVELHEEGRRVRLTEDGQLACRLLARQDARHQAKMASMQRVLILPDESAAPAATGRLDADALDRAIDDALAKAELYEAMRQALPAGPERTAQMDAMVAQARALAQQAGYEPAEVSQLFSLDTDGSRIVGLAYLQAKPDPQFFPLVLAAIDRSRSAFEQYHALRAMEEMLPSLGAEEKGQLRAVLEKERTHGHITSEDPGRWSASGRLLEAIS